MKKVLTLAMASIFMTGVAFANLDGGKGCCAKKADGSKACAKTTASTNTTVAPAAASQKVTLANTSATPVTVAKENCKGTKADCASKEAKGACCSKSSAKAATKEVKADKEVSIN